MSKTIAEIEAFKSSLRPYLINYLTSKGVQVAEKKLFRCINPEHDDTDPSCGIVPESNGQYFHCFGCMMHGDIFKAASLLEGKPMDGPEFLYDNVYYIAKLYGLKVPEVQMSEEDLYEHKVRQAYRDAAFILLQSTPSPLVSAKIAEYAWRHQTLKSLGIGGIDSYDEFINKLVKLGYSRQFLRDIDLDNKQIFNANCLIYTVRDDRSSPVGFAARNLMYDEAKKKWEKAVAEFGEHSPQAKDLKKKVPSKYCNTTERDPNDSTKVKNPIYQKSKRLFGFHIARKKEGQPIYVFEGYSDCATAHNAGLHNSCAIGSVSFSRQHLELVLSYGIKHVIFTLDADAAGNRGTARFMDMVDEVLGGNIGFNVEVLTLPSGSDDPDAFIRKNGLQAFLELPKLNLFGWRLEKALSSGEAAPLVAEKMAKIIVNEPAPPVRYEMAKQVAVKLGIPTEVIYDMVKMLVDEDRAKLEEQRTAIAQKAVKQLQQDPSRIGAVIEQVQMQLETLGAELSGYNSKTIVETIRHSRKMARTSTGIKRLKTGWEIFDEKFGGIPAQDAFIAIPGKPNQGKTSLMVNLFWRVVEYNPEAICFYHTMDDALNVFLPRVLGSRAGIPSVYFQETAEYEHELQTNGLFAKIEEGDQWLDAMVSSLRLGAADSSVLPRDIGALATYIRDLRRQWPDRPLVIFADNFAHYDIRHGAPSEGEGRVSYIARFAKDLAIKYHTTLLMTMELPKTSLSPGIRPRVVNIKGSASIAYEASANIGVYNDLKDFGHKATLHWDDSNDLEEYTGPTGETLTRKRRKPIIELVFDKSKIYKGFDGTIYYRLYPETGRYEECSREEQSHYESVAQQPKEEEIFYQKPSGNGNSYHQHSLRTPPKQVYSSDDEAASFIHSLN